VREQNAVSTALRVSSQVEDDIVTQILWFQSRRCGTAIAIFLMLPIAAWLMVAVASLPVRELFSDHEFPLPIRGGHMPALDMDHNHPDLVFGPSDIRGMRNALRSAGCFVVRGLFDGDAIRRTRERAAAVAVSFDAKVDRGDTEGYETFLAGAYGAGHLPETELDAPMTTRELLQASSYETIAKNLFGAASHGFALRRSHFKGAPNPLGFHQDAFFMDFSYNFWTPLNDAGVTSPNVEVIVGSGEPLFSLAGISDSVLTEQHLRRCYGDAAFWHPILNAGDVLVFSTFLMHRTRQTPEMTHERYSIEIRGPISQPVEIAGVPPDPKTAKVLASIVELAEFKQARSDGQAK
jgi:hypothetical protein